MGFKILCQVGGGGLVNSVVKVQSIRPSEARLINSAAKPPAERSKANKISIYLYMFSAEGEQLFFTYVLIG